VSYRRKGETAWRQALPLPQLDGEVVSGGVPRDGGGEHFNHYIAPNTEYECRLLLSDPDGVTGRRERVATVRTRREPQTSADGHVYHFGYTGVRQEPAFTGLPAAYYTGSDQSDHSRELPPRAR
jgi:hypothetical protein